MMRGRSVPAANRRAGRPANRQSSLLPRSVVIVGTAVALAVGALAGCGGTIGGDGSGGDGTGAKVGTVTTVAPGRRTQAPALSGDQLDGGRYDLAAHRGEVVVINFWASWCAPCRAEAADLEAVHQAKSADKVSFVGIDVKDERDKASAFVAGRTTYPNVFDPASRLALGFKIPPNTIPATVVVDRAGRVAAVFRKAVTRTELEEVVTRVAAEDGGRYWAPPSPTWRPTARCCSRSGWPRWPAWSVSCRPAYCRWCPATCPT